MTSLLFWFTSFYHIQSFFNATVLKKDLTRFAPVWILYTVINFLIFLFNGLGSPGEVARNVANLFEISAVINCIYALIIVLTVFGDLFQFRMVGVLHSMPLRREGWFLSHTVSCLMMGLLPNALLTLAMLPRLYSYCAVLPLLWFAVSSLEFLFFFGLAVFSCQLAGNRIGTAFVYGIANFACLLVYVLVDVLYIPMLYGITLNLESFATVCPVVWLSTNSFILHHFDYATKTFTLQGYQAALWWYLAAFSLIGVGLWSGALLLFRKRRMEAAGDFIAIRSLSPLYMVMHILLCAAFFNLLSSIFGYSIPQVLFGVGAAVGYFTGLMFLNRTVRVFSRKSILAFLILAAILTGSVFFVASDPLGRVSYVPEPEEVASVTIGTETHNPEVIAQVTKLHEALIDDRGTDEDWHWNMISISYQLKSGKTLYRTYRFPTTGQTYMQAKSVLSRPEIVFGTDDFQKFTPHIRWIGANLNTPLSVAFVKDNLTSHEKDMYFRPDVTLDAQALQELLDAIAQDCMEGHMMQYPIDHKVNFYAGLQYALDNADDEPNYIDIWEDAEHTVQYLEKIASEHPAPLPE